MAASVPKRPRDLQPSHVRAGKASAAAAKVEATFYQVDPDPSAAAFFDVDNTVMRGASVFHLARGLMAHKLFSPKDLAGFAVKQAKFRILGSEDLADMSRATETALSFVAGRKVSDIVALGEEIFDEFMVDKLWPGTLAMAEAHLDAGQRVWLVTASPVELATITACRLGLTGALGTVSEIVDGVYTGRLIGQPLHGAAKAEAVMALAEREGLDLERCAAYSDSANDVPMLSIVGDPCAVNPDAQLRDYARREGWRIKEYRTGRKAAKAGLPMALGAAAAAGAGVGALALRHRWQARRAS